MTNEHFKNWQAKRKRILERLGKPRVEVKILPNERAQVTIAFEITPKERVALVDCCWNDPQGRVADGDDIVESMEDMVRGEREMWLDFYPGGPV